MDIRDRLAPGRSVPSGTETSLIENRPSRVYNRRMNARVTLVLMALALCASAASCSSCEDEKGCERGGCRAGNCLVGGECVEVVGRPCAANADCQSDICMARAQGDPDAYCSYACATVDDCPQGYVCAGDPARCAKSSANDVKGCVSSTECGACGLCVDGKCAATSGCPLIRCTDAAPCPTCMDCAKGQCVPKDGCTGDQCKVDKDCGGCAGCVHGVCFNPPDCAAPPCATDDDCPAGLACVTSGVKAGTCVTPGADAIGADCTAGDPSPCNGGICYADDQSTYCTVDCTGDSGLCPYGFSCKIVADGLRYCRKTGDTPVLGKDCQREKDCDTDKGETCVFVTDAKGTTVEPKCSLPFPDGLPLGSSCAQAGDCETNLCPSGSAYCSLPCVHDADCWYGYVCEGITFDLGGSVVAARGCVYREDVPGRPGDYCPNGTPDCRAGTCPAAPAGGPEPVCLVPCANGAATCPDDTVCRADDVFGTAADACLPDMLPQECAGDSGCDAGTVCALAKDADGGTALVACTAAHAGGRKPGEACNYTSGDPYCENGQCGSDSFCMQYCDNESTCRDGAICDYQPVDLADGTVKYVRACVERRGSRLPCTLDSECADGEVCRPWSYPGGSQTHFGCQPPRAGGSAAGAACGAGSPDHNAYCANDLCTAEGTCTTHCAKDEDCANGKTCGLAEAKIVTGETIWIQACKGVSSQGDIGAPCPNGYLDCKSELFCADIGYDADGGTLSICTTYCGGDTGVDCAARDAGGPALECRSVNGNDLCVPVDNG